MSHGQPKTEADAVADRLLTRLLTAGHTGDLSAFERARFVRDIEEVTKSDAQSAFLMRAVLATLDGDIDEAERQTERARLLKAPNASAQRMYALSNLGYAKRAQAVAKAEMRSGAPRLSDLIVAAIPVGSAVTAARAIDESRDASLVLSANANAAVDAARRITRSLAMAGRTEDELVAILDVAGESMRKRRLLWLDGSPQVITLNGQESDDGLAGVHYLYRVDITPQEAALLTGEVGWKALESDVARPNLSVAFVGSRVEAVAA